MPVFYRCNHHNYFGGIPCPKCFPIETANHDARKSRDDLAPAKGIFGWIMILTAIYVIGVTLYLLSKKGII
jgi:hypothetical protein